MLDVEYYKDYRHNYLILKRSNEQKENEYQRKMITENSIKGLLECQERHINGELFMYYEITSRQSFSSIYMERSIETETLYQFFLQLKLVNDLLQKYLLDEKGLVLFPEYIFQNIETGEVFFLYYPDAGESSLLELMNFFMEKVNNEDAGAVETVYKIADLIQREQFVLDEVLDWLWEEMEEKEGPEKREMPEETERTCEERAKEAACDFKEESGPETDINDRKKLPLLLLGIGGLGIVLLIYIMNTYCLSKMEERLLIIGWSGAVLLIAGVMLHYCCQRFLDKGRINEKSGREPLHKGCVSLEYEMQKPEVTDCGDTVFIPWTDHCENRLYGMDKGNKYHIDLGHLPLTVGKLAGAVDMVIDEQGISRMHARFSRTGSKICITDLNSTNGTFKNGLRLQPNDSEIIEPGDEIRLGKLKFIYR